MLSLRSLLSRSSGSRRSWGSSSSRSLSGLIVGSLGRLGSLLVGLLGLLLEGSLELGLEVVKGTKSYYVEKWWLASYSRDQASRDTIGRAKGVER